MISPGPVFNATLQSIIQISMYFKAKYKYFTGQKLFALSQIVFAKGGFFSESVIRFSNLQISKKDIPKNYPQLEI